MPTTIWTFTLLLRSTAGVHVEVGPATVYRPGDGFSGSRKADGTLFRRSDRHIAHRWLPLHIKGILCNERTRRCVRTYVADRGPFGALLPCDRKPDKAKRRRARRIHWRGRCYWWQAQTKLAEGWRYRGKFDLSEKVARAIGHRAFDRVVFIYRRRPKRRRARRADSR